MSALFDAVAAAALPVAIGLLVLTAVARAVPTARQYAQPLSLWCLASLVAYALGSAAAGTASYPSIALTLIVAAAAVLLRPGADAAPREPGARPAAHRPAPAAPPATPATPAPGRSLWAQQEAREPAERHGLWSR
jgi:hypothetical protein